MLLILLANHVAALASLAVEGWKLIVPLVPRCSRPLLRTDARPEFDVYRMSAMRDGDFYVFLAALQEDIVSSPLVDRH
jgi:hypothetical protein